VEWPPKANTEQFGPLIAERSDVMTHYLAAIIESSDDAILSKDLNSIIRSWNKGAERLFGYTAAETLGSSVTMLIPAERQDEERVILNRILRGERIDHYETIRQRKDGTLIEISLTVSPIRTAEGHIIGASKAARDISERKRAEAVLQRPVAIVDSSNDAIISKDLNGIITSWNSGAERVFGYRPDEAIGRSVLMLIPTDRRDEEPTIIERIKRGERVEHYDTVRQRKDGTLVEISLTVSPIRAPEGHIIGASKIARDITERKQAQLHQQFLIRELRHRSANLFAVIQSIVSRSLVEPYSLAQGKEVLSGRLHALAGAHSMLAQAAWTGAPPTAILKQELSGFSDQLSISGCDLIVNTPAAQQFSLMAHELAPNATKYGALSAPKADSVHIEA
jgi:PAS domain S-box-containing protein